MIITLASPASGSLAEDSSRFNYGAAHLGNQIPNFSHHLGHVESPALLGKLAMDWSDRDRLLVG